MVVRAIDAIAACKPVRRTYVLENIKRVRNLHSLKDKLHLGVVCVSSVHTGDLFAYMLL